MVERIWSTPFERADVDGMSDEQLAAYLASDEANFHDWADCLACYGFHVQEQRVAAIAALEAGGRGVSAPTRCMYCHGDNPDCGFCDDGLPLDTQEDWDRTWGRVSDHPKTGGES